MFTNQTNVLLHYKQTTDLYQVLPPYFQSSCCWSAVDLFDLSLTNQSAEDGMQMFGCFYRVPGISRTSGLLAGF